MTDKVQKILSEITTRKLCTMDEHMAFYNDKAKEDYRLLSEIEEVIKALQEKPVSEELEEAADEYTNAHYQIFNEYHYEFGDIVDDIVNDKEDVNLAFKAGAKWQEKKDKETIELAEDHAMLAGMEKMREEEWEHVKYQLELRLPETLDYNGIKVNRIDFINDFTKAMKDE